MEADLAAALAQIRAAVVEAARTAAELRSRVQGIPCRAGCSGCCGRSVRITLSEALILADYLSRHGKLGAVLESAERMKETAATASPRAWFKMGIQCPILKDGVCEAYPVRPVACSAHFVVSHPKLCSASSTAAGTFAPYRMPGVHEAFEKAVLRASEKNPMLAASAPLPIAILLAGKIMARKPEDLESLIDRTARGLGLG